MRAAVLSILMCIGYVLQSSFFVHLQIFGARPDLVLAVVVAAAIASGPFEGLLVGLLGGALIDLMRGTFMGLSIPGKMVIGLVVGFIPKRIYADRVLVPIVTAFAATICDQLIFLWLGQSFGLKQPFWESFQGLVLSSAFYTALVAPLALEGVRNLYQEFRERGWYKEQRVR